MIVLDTNVLSETLRLQPANSVKRWMEIQSATSLFTTSICQAEILYGVGLLAPGRRRTALENAIAAIFDEEFAVACWGSTVRQREHSPKLLYAGGGWVVPSASSMRKSPRSRWRMARLWQPGTSRTSSTAE
jgi:hypothetical protein